ncbi:MAG: AAA family ATPase, partial [Alphaproteobacteria bacterium]|nr:AAA family ATPase [Alphaproteobacteria bacterium]
MYLEHYGLSDFPFQLTPDPRFFFESSVHRKAMAHLLFGLSQGEGFIIITGDVGAGKTTLLGHLLETIDSETFVTAKIVSSHLDGENMLRAVASALNLEFQGLDKASLLSCIETLLRKNFEQGKRVLLMVDEAQNVTLQALEELRMLSNFQVGNRAPLQSVLLGQPQFRHILTSPDLTQFRQRIVASYHLGAMNAEETSEYIRHRLSLVGWTNNPEITDAAFAEIFTYTGGVPRKINTLCSRLMLFCSLDDLRQIDPDVVTEVADDLSNEMSSISVPPGSAASGGVMHAASEQSSIQGIPEILEQRLAAIEKMAARESTPEPVSESVPVPVPVDLEQRLEAIERITSRDPMPIVVSLEQRLRTLEKAPAHDTAAPMPTNLEQRLTAIEKFITRDTAPLPPNLGQRLTAIEKFITRDTDPLPPNLNQRLTAIEKNVTRDAAPLPPNLEQRLMAIEKNAARGSASLPADLEQRLAEFEDIANRELIHLPKNLEKRLIAIEAHTARDPAPILASLEQRLMVVEEIAS